ncbi:unannotated protein [freshwater metagenome]|uniref:Unannotated protein n=1 Tax=freshwater metagenome TaxID=449393 RepID=A0A6J7LKG0_9ZZZZ
MSLDDITVAPAYQPKLPDRQHLILHLFHVPASVGNGTKSLKRGAKSSTRYANQELRCLCSDS